MAKGERGGVVLEESIPEGVMEMLEKKGYKINVLGPWDGTMGKAEAILLHPESDTLMGGAGPRREGYALG